MNPYKIYPAGTEILVSRDSLPLSTATLEKPLTWGAIKAAAAAAGFKAIQALDP